MIEFLLILAGIYLAIASVCDLKKREVPNWLSFSLILFAMAYRAFYSAVNSDFYFFLYGLIGFAFFFVLAYAFYYARIFAGGDAKLLMALGSIMFFLQSFSDNLVVLIVFIFLLLFVGGIYGLIYSFALALKNKEKFGKEFLKQAEKRKIMILLWLTTAILILAASFYFSDFIILALSFLIFIFPFLFVHAKAVEESCLIIEISSKKITVGDWLYEPVKIGRKVIKPDWEGLSEEEVGLIKKFGKKKIKVKYGIPFVPAFLFAFLIFIWLGYPSWEFFNNFWLLS